MTHLSSPTNSAVVVYRAAGEDVDRFVEAESLNDALKSACPEGWQWSYKIFDESGKDVTPSPDDHDSFLLPQTGKYLLFKAPNEPISGTFAAIAAWVSAHTVLAVVGLVAISALVFALFLGPKIPGAMTRSGRRSSSNNSFSERSNDPASPGSRIPDIYGEDISYPTLLQNPYIKYDAAGKQMEYSLMCVSSGQIQVSDMKDGTNPLATVAGYGAKVYWPGTSPNHGTPILTQGDSFTEPMYVAIRSNDVSGQLLEAPNRPDVAGANNIRFIYPDTVETSSTDINFSDVFKENDTVEISGAIFNFASSSINLSGSYTVLSVVSDTLVLQNPAAVNADWDSITLPAHFPSGTTNYSSAIVKPTTSQWIGPFILDQPDLSRVWLNLQAPQGLYKDDGTNQYAITLEAEMELTPVGADLTPSGSPQVFTASLKGSATDQDLIGVTIDAVPTVPGRQSVRIRRKTDTDKAFSGAYIDKLYAETLYSVAQGPNDLGDMTMVQLKVRGTNGAMVVKDRKFNCRAKRMIPKWQGTAMGTTLEVSSDPAEILVFMATHPRVGRLLPEDVDYEGIFAVAEELKDYSGGLTREFNYTFDNSDISFEESCLVVAQTMSCYVGRPFGKLTLLPDWATNPTKLLFNHRNIIPGTYNKSVRFGKSDDADGVEFAYKSLKDGEEKRVIFYDDSEPTNLKKLEAPGIKRDDHAKSFTRREFHRFLYDSQAVDFECGAEGVGLYPGDRILVAREESAKLSEGEVSFSGGQYIGLSQPFTPEPGVEYLMFLQNPTGFVESIAIEEFLSEYDVKLTKEPSFSLRISEDGGIKTAYVIVKEKHSASDLYTVMERKSDGYWRHQVSCTKYDPRSYAPDNLKLRITYTVTNTMFLKDRGYLECPLTATNAVTVEGTFKGLGSDSVLIPTGFTTSKNYTKIFQIKFPGVGVNANIFSAPTSAVVATDYVKTVGTTIVAGHGESPTVSVAAPTLTGFIKVAVTYRADTKTLSLYINSDDPVTAQADPAVLGPLVIAQGFTGTIKRITYLTRCITKEEVRTMMNF